MNVLYLGYCFLVFSANLSFCVYANSVSLPKVGADCYFLASPRHSHYGFCYLNLMNYKEMKRAGDVNIIVAE